MTFVCLGCLWTLQKMRERNSSVVSEPSGSTGVHYHRFVKHTEVDSRRFLIGQIFFFKWHHLFLQDSHDQCVQWIVRFIHSQHSPKRIAFLYDCLAMAVETSLLPPRYTHTNEHRVMVHSHKLCQKSIWWFLLCFLKDCMWSSYRLWKFGVGKDSAVGADLQTHSEDYWRGGLQGLCLPFSLTHKQHSNLLATIAFLISS